MNTEAKRSYIINEKKDWSQKNSEKLYSKNNLTKVDKLQLQKLHICIGWSS